MLRPVGTPISQADLLRHVHKDVKAAVKTGIAGGLISEQTSKGYRLIHPEGLGWVYVPDAGSTHANSVRSIKGRIERLLDPERVKVLRADAIKRGYLPSDGDDMLDLTTPRQASEPAAPQTAAHSIPTLRAGLDHDTAPAAPETGANTPAGDPPVQESEAQAATEAETALIAQLRETLAGAAETERDLFVAANAQLRADLDALQAENTRLRDELTRAAAEQEALRAQAEALARFREALDAL